MRLLTTTNGNGSNNITEKTMNKIYIHLQLFIGIMLMVSCANGAVDDITSDDTTDNTSQLTSLVAIQEVGSLSTRASLNSTSGTNVWKQDDELLVYDSSASNTFTLSAGQDTEIGTFTGKATLSTDITYTALYPESAGTITAEGKANVTLQSLQTATAGSYDPNAMLMIGKGSITGNVMIPNISMKNAVALVQVTPLFDCQSITLTSSDSKIAGTGTIDYTSSEPKLTITDASGSNTITLQGQITSGSTYYIVVPAVTLSEGWSISFTNSSNVVKTRKTNRSITFNRNTITNLGKFSADALYWQ